MAEGDEIQGGISAEHAAMKLLPLTMAAVLSVAFHSVLGGEPSACHCLAYTEASLSPPAMAAISEFEAALRSARTLAWDRDVLRNLLRITSGAATVLSIETDETTCGAPGGYRVADCGLETMIVMSLDGRPAAGKIFSFEKGRGNITAVYRGDMDGPGRSGCFGISASGTALIVAAAPDSLTTSVDVEYELFRLFDFPRPCGSYKLHGVYRMIVRHAES